MPTATVAITDEAITAPRGQARVARTIGKQRLADLRADLDHIRREFAPEQNEARGR